MYHLIVKKILTSVFLFGLLTPFFATAQTGNHFGEQEFISYRIEYLDSPGITTADAAGITYESFAGYYRHEDKILPERYFGIYSLYFAKNTMRFKLFLKNNRDRTFRNLKIETFQEFLNTEGGRGGAMGDNNKQAWFLEKFGPGEEIVLSGEFNIPSLGEGGIDQTHLRISHNTASDREKGEIILEDFQAGLWCPLKS